MHIILQHLWCQAWLFLLTSCKSGPARSVVRSDRDPEIASHACIRNSITTSTFHPPVPLHYPNSGSTQNAKVCIAPRNFIPNEAPPHKVRSKWSPFRVATTGHAAGRLKYGISQNSSFNRRGCY